MHQTDPRPGYPGGTPDPGQGELTFELLAEIAIGATARVELSRVVSGRLQGELVAVKRLHPHIAEDQQFVDMFRDEVWMTAALKHQHVVEVVGWGQDNLGPWLAVEFVRGVSLQRLMKTVFETREQFTERMVVYLAVTIADGLAAAHALRSKNGEHLNLVHRDLWPGNVLLGFDGEVKITDFGLAKAKQRLTKTLTGLLKGQPQYMSPEQVQGQALDGRSDVFAMGVLLFELFSGRRPWNAASDLDAMRAITDEPPADLASLRPRIDKALVEIAERCLQKDPMRRYTAAELRDRLREWLSAHGYRSDNDASLARFVRRNAMRQMRWFERAIAGEFAEEARAHQPMMQPPLAVLQRAVHDDDRPWRMPEDAPPMRDEAPTRVTEEEDDDDIDWGEDGPTLIKKADQAREAIERARVKTRQLPELPTRRQKKVRSSAERSTDEIPKVRQETDLVDDEDAYDVATTPGRRDDVIAAIREAERLARAAGGAREAEGPAYDSRDTDGDPTVQLDDAGARVREILDKQASQRRPALGPGALGVVAPPDPDVPPLPDSQLGGPGNIGILPAPRFPSDPSLSAEIPSTDFHGESRRLQAAAATEANNAETARQKAVAARRAAALASQAVLLAAEGQLHQALLRLREAQRIDTALARGGILADTTIQIDGAVVLPVDKLRRRVEELKRHLRTREGVTIAVIGAIGVLLLVLLVVALVL